MALITFVPNRARLDFRYSPPSPTATMRTDFEEMYYLSFGGTIKGSDHKLSTGERLSQLIGEVRVYPIEPGIRSVYGQAGGMTFFPPRPSEGNGGFLIEAVVPPMFFDRLVLDARAKILPYELCFSVEDLSADGIWDIEANVRFFVISTATFNIEYSGDQIPLEK